MRSLPRRPGNFRSRPAVPPMMPDSPLPTTPAAVPRRRGPSCRSPDLPDPGKIGAPNEATGSKPLNPRSGSMQAFVPLRQVPGRLLVAEGVLAGQEHGVSVLVQGRVPGQRGELRRPGRVKPALLVGHAGAARPRSQASMWLDHANVSGNACDGREPCSTRRRLHRQSRSSLSAACQIG